MSDRFDQFEIAMLREKLDAAQKQLEIERARSAKAIEALKKITKFQTYADATIASTAKDVAYEALNELAKEQG